MDNLKKIKGVVVPMVSPFTSEGTIDTQAVKKIIHYLFKANVSVFIQGTTGEALSISNRDRIRFAEAVIEEERGKEITVYAGISHHCFEDSVELAHQFFERGIDIVTAHLPSYYPLTDAHILRYYQRLADAVPGPVLLYNIPQTVGTSIPLEVADKLSYHENICGIKDSEQGLGRLEQAVRLWKNRSDFSHLTGRAAHSAHALSIGTDSIVPSAGNFLPLLFQQLYETALSGDKESAKKLQEDANIISQIYQKNKNLSQSLAALKVMMEHFDLCDPFVLPPLTACTQGEREEIISRIESCEQLHQLQQIKK